MNAVVIASDEVDARAAEAVEQHHAQLAGTLALKAEALAAAARAARTLDPQVRADLVDWCGEELIPHALAEEKTLYAAAAQRPEARLLVEAMHAEHRVIIGLVKDLEATGDAVSAAVLAAALRAVFEVHLAKENDQVLPLLVSAPDVSLAELRSGMEELLAGHAAEGTVATESTGTADSTDEGGCGAPGHACGCGETDRPAHPELDARAIPHAIRHATVFGALDGIRPGKGLILVAPHDPRPLLAQLEQRAPGAFAIEYLERGPDRWRLLMVRRDRIRSDG
jgi:uncharacterized protein (DUF2249 family)